MAKTVDTKKRLKAPYLQFGAKWQIAPWIVSYFPEHTIFLDCCFGSGAVFFTHAPSPIEIVNDLDGRIIRMFEVLRSRPEELAALLWATPYSASNWRDVPVEPEALEEARLLIAQGKQFYSGRRPTATWAMDICPAAGKTKPQVWADRFQRVLPAARLKDVTILNEDCCDAAERVADRADALIYYDPPYLGHEDDYEFAVDYPRMSEILHAAKAKVIVSEFPTGEKFFGDWQRIERVLPNRGATERLGGGARKKVEVLFMNFEPVALPVAA